MKNALVKDFLREIRKNIGRFLSIFFIVMLGTAFFSGLRSSGPDMKYSADRYYRKVKLMDLRLLSTLGFEEEDLADLEKLESVERAAGGKTAEVMLSGGEDETAILAIARTEGINEVYLTEGRLPENERECVVDDMMAAEMNIQIGDRILLKSGTKDKLSASLTRSVFTVTGRGSLPYYMDLTRGNGSIGDGTLRGFIVLEPEVFNFDYYTEAYIKVAGAEEYVAYSKDYDKVVDGAEHDIETLADFAVIRRYDRIQGDGRLEIEDARRQIEDARAQLEDARQQLAEAAELISDAEKELAEGEKELEEGEAEIAENEAKIAAGEADLAAGEAELAAGEAQVRAGAAEVAAGEASLAENKALLADLERQYAEGSEGLATMRQQLDEGAAQLEEAKAKKAQIELLLPAAQEALEIARLGLDYINSQLETDPENELFLRIKAELETRLPELESTVTEMEEGLARMEEEIPKGEAELAENEALYEQYSADLAFLAENITLLKNGIVEGEAALAEGKAQVAAGQAQVDSGRAELDAGRAELENGKAQLEEGKAQLEEGRAELEEGKAELAEKKDEYEDARAEFDSESEKAEAEIADAEKKIADAEAELAELEVPEWYILDRGLISSCASFGQDAERISKLGDVFPVMFFLVAALVSLASMTRMVEEQRQQIGTLKALGFSGGAIAAKYICYALLATVTGGIIGVVIGEKLIPYVVQDAYRMLYVGLPEIYEPMNYGQGILAVVISTACTGLASLGACWRKLKDKPAELMRPEAPKGGRRVFLEHITGVWNRLKFSRKATIRNLLRYKKRFFMTIFGVGGCMGLILVGYGLEDSITEVAKNQYVEIFTYEAYAAINKTADEAEKENLKEVIAARDDIDSVLEACTLPVTLKKDGTNRDAYLFVPEDVSLVPEYVVLRDRVSQEGIDFPETGCALSEKTADMLGVGVGDTIFIQESDKSPQVEVEVKEIVENYVLHYCFFTPETYEALFGKAPEYDTIYMNYQPKSEAEEKQLGRELLDIDACSSVYFITDLEQQIDDMLGALHYVMYVLIISAALLAFVVIYNLNSINMTERRRELATLKVLGFYDTEVAMYVYRENIILTILGIILGVFLGTLLHRYVILTVEVDLMMFGRIIGPRSYLICAALTGVFSLAVNLIMFRSFKKIDMIESLKSVE